MGLGLMAKIFPSLVERFLQGWFLDGLIPTIANISPMGDKGYISPINGIAEQIPNDLLMAGGLSLIWMLLALVVFKFAKSDRNWKIQMGVLWAALPGVLLSLQQIILVPPESPYLPPQVISLLKKHAGNGRWASHITTLSTPLPHWIRENYFHHQLFSQQHQHGGILHGLSNIAGYVSLPPKDYLHLANGYAGPDLRKAAKTDGKGFYASFSFDQEFPFDTKVLNILSTQAILLSPFFDFPADRVFETLEMWDSQKKPKGYCAPSKRWFMAAQWKDWKIYKNPCAMPLAWPATQWSFSPKTGPPRPGLSLPPPPVRATQLNSWGKNPRLVHTDTPLPIAKNTGPLLDTEKVIWTQGATPNLLQLKSTLAKKRLVLVSLPFDTAWKAQVDGQPVKLYKVNFALTGLVLPGGDHLVQLRYEPPWFSLAAAISLLFAVFALLLQAVARPLGAPAPPPHDG